MVNPNGVCEDPELRTGAGAERRGNPPVLKLRRPPTRGQAQQRQSRFRLFPRNNVDVATAFDQKKGKLERETRLELATSTLARWCSTN